MKIWLKLTIAAVLGLIIGIFVPDIKNFYDTTLFGFLSKITINLLLYLTLLYILVKLFLGIINLIRNKITYKVFSMFAGMSLLSVFTSIIISITIMNINLFIPSISVIAQREHSNLALTSINELFEKIVNANIFTSFDGHNNFILPVIFIAIIFGIAAFYADKKGSYFVETVESFNNILDIIVRQFLDIFAILAVFVFVSFVKSEVFMASNFELLIKPLIAIGLALTIICILYFLLLSVFLKINIVKFLTGFMGAGLTSFICGNSAASIIPLTEHLKKNIGINKSIAESLTPLGIIINKTGTIIVSTVTLMSIILIYTPERLTISLQLLFILLLFLTSFMQDGANNNAFLVIVALILKTPLLHLEETGFLLFLISMPLLSRIGILFDALSTSVFVTIVSKITNNIEEVKYIDYI